MGLREWAPSFVRKLHLSRFPAVFCKHPRARQCYRAHAQDVQHTWRAATVHLQKYKASYLCPELYAKTSVTGCDVAQPGLQRPRLVPGATGDSPATRSELRLRNLLRGASGPAACWREKPRQALSWRLAWASPAALIAHTPGLWESHENLPAIMPSRIRK